MKCYYCGQEIDDNENYCPYCGYYQGAGETVVLDQTNNPYAVQDGQLQGTAASAEAVPVMYAEQRKSTAEGAPRIQFSTNRSLLKMILLGLLTFGIYDLIVMCRLITELNVAACRHDGQRTMPYFAMLMLAPGTFGLLPLFWGHRLSNRIGAELKRRSLDCEFSAKTFWVWNVLGALILVGPLIYLHKLLMAMNLINGDFNLNG